MTTQSEYGTAEISRGLADLLVQAAGLNRAELAGIGDCTLAELGMESLAAIELQSVVGSRYGVNLPDELLELSVPQITVLIQEQLGRGN